MNFNVIAYKIKYGILRFITYLISPDWQDIAGHPGQITHFRIWLSQKPKTFQDKANFSDNPIFVAGLIRQFKRETGR